MLKKSPDVSVIAFTLILLAAARTWILPGGAYERRQETVGTSTREVVVPGSFKVEHFADYQAKLAAGAKEG